MKAKIKIFRLNPKKDHKPHFDVYELNYNKNTKVLDILLDIFYNYDSSISFDYCCKIGSCGLCGAMVNKKPVLICKEPITKHIVIEPLLGFKVIKDLIVDRDYYKERLKKIRLFLDKIPKEHKKSDTSEITFLEELTYASRCNECLCCLSICPVYNKNSHDFPGPPALVLEALYFFNAKEQLNEKCIIYPNGLELCIGCGKCSSVCPFKTDPFLLIRKMKKIKSALI